MILGASFDSPEENKAFKDKFNFPYDLLCDTGKSMGTAYGAAGDASASHPARISYLIDPEGKIEKVYPSVAENLHWRVRSARHTCGFLAHVACSSGSPSVKLNHRLKWPGIEEPGTAPR